MFSPKWHCSFEEMRKLQTCTIARNSDLMKIHPSAQPQPYGGGRRNISGFSKSVGFRVLQPSVQWFLRHFHGSKRSTFQVTFDLICMLRWCEVHPHAWARITHLHNYRFKSPEYQPGMQCVSRCQFHGSVYIWSGWKQSRIPSHFGVAV